MIGSLYYCMCGGRWDRVRDSYLFICFVLIKMLFSNRCESVCDSSCLLCINQHMAAYIPIWIAGVALSRFLQGVTPSPLFLLFSGMDDTCVSLFVSWCVPNTGSFQPFLPVLPESSLGNDRAAIFDDLETKSMSTKQSSKGMLVVDEECVGNS